MPLDEDKYPAESGRRRFVKGVVGSASLSGIASGGVAALDWTTGPVGHGGGPTTVFGIKNIAGPAPRGMPIIPIDINDNGELKGVPPKTEEELTDSDLKQGFNGSGVPYTWSWFQYCGVQTYAGLNPSFESDNMFHAIPQYKWMDDIDRGEVLSVDMFSNYETWTNGIGKPGIGKPADGIWRSEGENSQNIPIQVVRSERVSQMANGEGPYSDIDENVRKFIEAATAKDFIAWLNKCTHFCCVPGFKTSTYGQSDNFVYCPCHQSVYDPFDPVQETFTALPRPDN